MGKRGVRIRIQGLTHRYSARSALTFDRVEAEAQPGEALAIIGRSGAASRRFFISSRGSYEPHTALCVWTTHWWRVHLRDGS